MKKLIFIIILTASFLIPNSFSFAQNKDIDSLLNLLKTDKADTNKVNHLNVLGRLLCYRNPDTAIILGNQALDIITSSRSLEFTSAKEGMEEKSIRRLRSVTFGNLGSYYFLKADYFRTLDYYMKALKIDQELKNKKGIARHLSNIGNVYFFQGDYPKALDYDFKAIKMVEELGYKQWLPATFSNIGNIYNDQKNYPKALDYYSKALKISEKFGYKNGIETGLSDIGMICIEQGNYPQALDYIFKALKMAEELGDKYGIGRDLGNIGIIYVEQGDYPKALDYYFKTLKVAEEIGDKNRIASTFADIGSLYVTFGKFKEAEKYFKKALAIDNSVGILNGSRQTEESLSRLYDTTGRYELALIHYKKSIALKDTLFSQENKKQLVRKEMTYEFDKKEAATKAENEKQQAVAAAESKKQKFIIWSVFGGLLLVIVFAGFVFRSLRITRKQKNLIELQKNEVSLQKEIVEKQKEKITDSITYAQRIQQSILMEESEIQNYLPNSFIYFQPKDIVSGDFYWFSKLEDKLIIAAVDCTGHGVPGAFMSMIGNTLLNQIVNEKQIVKPSEILNHLNVGVYEALHQQKDGALSDDGMAIALCVIDYKNKEVQFAGAENPLYIVSNGEIEIIKSDSHGIGGGGMLAKRHDPLKKEFTNHVIAIKEGMSVYLFTDGYMDQFGGLERKKLGAQKFKELLLNNEHVSMQQQKEQLASAHTAWRGSSPQIDDVLVIGIKI